MRKALLAIVFLALLLSPVFGISIGLFLNYDGSCDVKYSDIPYGMEVPLPEDTGDVSFQNSSESYSLSFRTQTLTQKEGVVWSVVYSSPFDAELTVRFPAGARVTGEGEITTNDGLIYLRKWVDAGEEVDIGYTLYAEKEEFPWALAVGAVALVAVFAYLFHAGKPARGRAEYSIKVDEKKLELLPDTERKIVEFLLGHDGVTQKDVEAGVSLPKSTVSRVLKSLEVKGFVERKKVGLSKKIFLSGSFVEQIGEKKPAS